MSSNFNNLTDMQVAMYGGKLTLDITNVFHIYMLKYGGRIMLRKYGLCFSIKSEAERS